MNTVKISTPMGSVEIVLRGRGVAYELACPFVPLEQVEFVDAVERTFDLYEIKRCDGGGCVLLFRTRTESQRMEIVEIVEGLFSDYFRG